MAGTSIAEINDIFLMLINDYRLTLLYQSSGSQNFNTYLEPWLLLSIDDFSDICNQELTYDTISQSFSQTLNSRNKNILSQLMVKYWLQKEVNDVLQMNNLIQDHDFKTFSAAQNLTAKQNFYGMKKEELSQLLQDYAYKNNGWTSWNAQNFGGA